MLWLAVFVGLFAAGLALALVGYAPRIGYTLQEPAEAEAKRLREFWDDLAAPDADIRIRTTTREGAVECDLLGLPGRRTLVVSDAALEQLDDESLRALLAVEAERARSRIEIPQAASSGVAVGVITAAYVTPLPPLPAFLVGWAIVLGAIVLVRHQYYAADAAAADKVGEASLRDVIRRAAEMRGESLETGPRWRALFDVEPSVGARMERLAADPG